MKRAWRQLERVVGTVAVKKVEQPTERLTILLKPSLARWVQAHGGTEWLTRMLETAQREESSEW